MPEVEGAGVALHYDERGDGRPLLVVHGMASDAAAWAPALDELAAAGARAIAYDRRGYGASGAPQPYAATTIQEQAEDAAALMTALERRAGAARRRRLRRARRARAARAPAAARDRGGPRRPAAVRVRGVRDAGARRRADDARAGAARRRPRRGDPRVDRLPRRHRPPGTREHVAARVLRRLRRPAELVAVAARAAGDRGARRGRHRPGVAGARRRGRRRRGEARLADVRRSTDGDAVAAARALLA